MSDEVPQTLLQAALDVQARAYAPYSGFRVGAAIATQSRGIFTGTNVENASFGLTICAERNAVAAAVAAGDAQFTELLVVSTGQCPPCGACRQVLYEFTSALDIWLVDPAEVDRTKRMSLQDLLPHAFALQTHSRQA